MFSDKNLEHFNGKIRCEFVNRNGERMVQKVWVSTEQRAMANDVVLSSRELVSINGFSST